MNSIIIFLENARMISYPKRWHRFFSQPKILAILRKINRLYKDGNVYPEKQDLFNAFRHIPPKKVKVVIIGQDPYHDEGQANGLAFSVRPGVKIPPTLRNIFTELGNNGYTFDKNNGDLTPWCRQGVLLLNTYLTVEAHKPGSHKEYWIEFTNELINWLDDRYRLIFILWGRHAQNVCTTLSDKQIQITSPHPSPYSANSGFFGSRPFILANEYLQARDLEPIDWNLI